MPSINVSWKIAKENDIIDGDFYLADLLSLNNETIKEKLSVLLQSNKYRYNKQTDAMGMLFREADFVDGQRAHRRFWAKYERPPKEEYWDYIIDRRDLLVPQDIRERKGSFYTPKIWVELSQRYIADVFGEDWQDEYYVWDCAAGTGNLLAGLTNPRKVWASDLFDSNVAAMKAMGGMFENHVFQFDFLNDDFKKLPKELLDIVNDEKKRKKLIIYINPPYAEVSSVIGKGKAGVNQSKVHDKYISILGTAGREVHTQFLARIYNEISNCKIGEFSKLKILQGSAFEKFRAFFHAKLEKMFIVPADTFDNVSGQFPIGFKLWDTNKKDKFEQVTADVFDLDGNLAGNKFFCSYDKGQYINKWISSFKNQSKANIGFLAGTNGNGFQNNNIVFILNDREQLLNPRGIWINENNIIPVSIYLAIRHCIPATWLNDRDQFLYPNDGWKKDKAFQNDCLAYTLFHGQNNISSKFGVNHWLPFSEEELGVHNSFDSHFMLSFIGGKIIQNGYSDLFEQNADKWCVKRKFSREASAVFSAGRELWKYYHAQPKANPNASLYDIREHFQGRNENGKMNNKSADEEYNKLIGELRERLKILAGKIEPKVYEYGFLKA
jgi:hypothetical protein